MLNPERVFYHFDQICHIPHISGEESAIADYLEKQGEKFNLQVARDHENNIIIKLPCKNNDNIVILQAHTDMVWEDIERENNNQKKIPRDIHIKDGKMRTLGTTLGADDGIGVAIIIALLEEYSANENGKLSHPAIEAVFTSNEEETMGGAMAISAEQIKGKYLINLDSEQEGVFTMGAAGGISSVITIPIERELSKKKHLVKITVSGGKSGHSGLEIGKQRINAIKFLVRFLQSLGDDFIEISSISGGNRQNAIPENAVAKIAVDDFNALTEKINKFFMQSKNEWCDEEPEIKIQAEKIGELKLPEPIYIKDCQKRILTLIESLPHGVYSRTEEFVLSSVNMAIVRESKDELFIELSLRSSYELWYQNEAMKISRLAEAFGGKTINSEEYPAWAYQRKGKLLETFTKCYQHLFLKAPLCENVHAGVECGILMQNCPSIKEAISIGPTITGAHTIREELDIEAVQKVYGLLKMVLSELK